MDSAVQWPGSSAASADAAVQESSPVDAVVFEHSATVLTYNVAGLPQGVSGSDPLFNTSQMSPLLNQYDLVVVQEDFSYHDQLIAEAEHPYQSSPQAGGVGVADGLNRFSMHPFQGHERIEWADCSGYLDGSNDCLAKKGFSVATHSIEGVLVDVYNLHMDAGRSAKDHDARAAQVAQMVRRIHDHSSGRPLIVAGDTNLKDAADEAILAELMQTAQLFDVCRTLDCPDPDRIDRVFVRGNSDVEIVPEAWTTDERFVDWQGEPLSDHEAVGVRLSIRSR